MARFAENGLTVQQNNYNTIKTLCKATEVQFARMLGTPEKAAQFGASVISAVSTNPSLQNCDPAKVMQCALVAASLNLDVNPNLGMSAIIPYKSKGIDIPQFQVMVRGWIQLAMRSGEYKALDCVEVYEDEFEGFDPFKNQLNYRIVPDGQRVNGQTDKIVGYYAYFVLTNGASHCLYWTVKQVQEHGKKFSKSFYNAESPWQKNFDAMAKKTLIKQLLSKWGMLSTIMNKAIIVDQATDVKEDKEGNILGAIYADNPQHEEELIPEPRKEEAKKPAAENKPEENADFLADLDDEDEPMEGDIFDGN